MRRLRSSLGLAFQIAGSASLFGDWRTTFEFSQKLQEVSPRDIQRVVSTYFRKESRTVATLVKPAGDPGGPGEDTVQVPPGAGGFSPLGPPPVQVVPAEAQNPRPVGREAALSLRFAS